MSDLLCDKCGKSVPRSNSCVAFEFRFGDRVGAAIAIQDRHLFPVEGEHSCEGSSSRVVALHEEHGITGMIDTSIW